MFIIPAEAQSSSEFGYQMLPEKLLENTDGILQVYVISNDLMVPKEISNLQVISSDNAIVKVLGVENGNSDYTKNVSIKAIKPGVVTIVLAAPGFSSKEITLQVFNNNNHPTQILMKVTPEIFPIDGPRYGHIGIELATTGGLPVRAEEDTIVHLETPNTDTIKLENLQLTILAGKYYALTKFEIIGAGDAIIFAEIEGMEKISSIVEILEAEKPLKLDLSVFPKNFNTFSPNQGIAVILLTDASGEPVLAEEDIHFKIDVENSNTSVNTSNDFAEVIFDNQNLKIEKGSYSTFTKFSPRPNVGEFTSEISQTYNMFISAENILTEGATFKMAHDEIGALEGFGPSITDAIPFLTSGKKEIIGVTYYETEIEVSRQVGGSTEGTTNRELVSVTVPVQAKDDHEINFSSSELDSVNPINPKMKKGDNIVLVYGETGTVMPAEQINFYITDNKGIKTIQGKGIGPLEDDMSLVIEPLVPMVLAENTFPLLAYMNEAEEEEEGETATTDEDEEEIDPRLGVTKFIQDSVLTFSANESVEIDSSVIKRNQDYDLKEVVSKDVGVTLLSYQMRGFTGVVSLESHTTDPSIIHLSSSKNILANSKTLATIQLLDTAGNPVYAKNDITIKLVSNNEKVLEIPHELIIKSGEYFNTFEMKSIEEGEIELALLSEDFGLSKYEINIVDVAPQLSLELLGTMNWNERIEAKLSINIPKIQTSLDGFNVEWITEGGEVKSIDEETNKQGIAVLNIIANEKERISITAKVSGNGLSESTISETAIILNKPLIDEETSNEEQVGLPIDNVTLILIIIPVALGAGLIFLKRTDRLELITDKIPIGDKFEEIKEKISDIRNR